MGLRCGWDARICLARQMLGSDYINENENVAPVDMRIILTAFMPCPIMYGFTASATTSGLHLAWMSSLNSLVKKVLQKREISPFGVNVRTGGPGSIVFHLESQARLDSV